MGNERQRGDGCFPHTPLEGLGLGSQTQTHEGADRALRCPAVAFGFCLSTPIYFDNKHMHNCLASRLMDSRRALYADVLMAFPTFRCMLAPEARCGALRVYFVGAFLCAHGPLGLFLF